MEIIQVLEKPSSKRSKNELSALINQTKDIPFFKEYRDKGSKEIHEQCCAHMQYEFIQEKNLVFELGNSMCFNYYHPVFRCPFQSSIGDKFYLILNGRAEIHIKIGINDDQTPILKCVKVLEGGAGFGEVALMKNQPRLARIVCQKDCHLATLDKDSFVKILKQSEEDKLIKEMEFFANMPLFEKWNLNLLKLLYLNTFRVKLQKGDFLFKEGQSTNAVYIVCQGEFTATKQFTQEIDDDEECLQAAKQETLKFKSLQKDKSPTKVQRVKLFNDIFLNINVLVMWQPYELFGEDDIVNKRKRTYSVQCTSVHGEVAMIKKYDFLHRVMWEDTSRQIILDRLKIKDEWFNNKVEDVNNLMSYSDYASFYYNDMKIRNRIQGSLLETDYELREFAKQIQDAFEQNTTLVRFKRRRIAQSEDIPHCSSKDLRSHEIPIYSFGTKSQNYQKMNVLEKDAMDEKAKKGQRQPPDIMDELVKKFHQKLKNNYYQRFKKDGYEQFQYMAQHIEHQGLKNMILKDDRTNPILCRQKSQAEGLKRQSSQQVDKAVKKFGKVLLKIRLSKTKESNPDSSVQTTQQKSKNELIESQSVIKTQENIEDDTEIYPFFKENKEDSAVRCRSNTTNISTTLQNNKNQTIQSNTGNESDTLETRITQCAESPIACKQQQRQKYHSVDSFTTIQESPDNNFEKRVSKKLARINSQIGQITKQNHKFDFQQFTNSQQEEKESDSIKCANFFITNQIPYKQKTKKREPYKFEQEKMKILQITQPDINKNINSMNLDNKNGVSGSSTSYIIHSSNVMPNKLAQQRQKMKISKRSNNFMSQNGSEDSVQNLINKLSSENKQQQQTQQIRQISSLRSAKSYQSINNNIIFQSKQSYQHVSTSGQISIGPKQIVATSAKLTSNSINNDSSGTEISQWNSLQAFPRQSQSPLKLQKIINNILDKKLLQKQILQSVN